MGYKVVWDEKKQRYVPAKGESTAKKETYSWSSYKANNKSSKSGKKSNDTVDPIKTALGNAQNALNTNPGERNIQKLPNYTGGSTFQYLSNDLTPGVAGARDYNRFSTNLPKYEGEYLKNVYKPGGGKTLQIQNSANKFGVIARNSEGAAQDIIAEADSLGLSDDDIKLIQKQALELAKVANENENKARARTGDKTVLNGMPMSKEAKEYERLLNLYGRDQVDAALNKKTAQPSKVNVSGLFDSPDAMTRWLEGQYEAGDDAFDKQMQSILAEKNTIGSRAEMYNNYSREDYRNDLNVIYSYNNPAKRGNITEDDYMRAMVRAQAATGQDFKSAVSNGLDVNWFKGALDAYDSGQKSMYEELKASGALDQDMSYEDYLDNMEAVNAQAAMQEKKQQRMEDWQSQTSAQSAQIQGNEDYGAASAYRQDNSIGQLTPNADYLSGSKIYYDAEGNAMRPEEYRQAVIDSILNEYVAAGDDADARAALEGYSGLIPELQNYNLEAIPYMSDEQKSNFFYLYNSGDKNGARAYLEALDYGLQAQRYQDMASQYTADMQENTGNKVLGSIASVPRNLMNNLAGAGVWAANTLGLDTYADMHEFNPLFDYTTKAQIARGETGQAIADATEGFEILGTNIPQAGYNAFMSASDSAMNAFLFGRGGSVSMGSGAYMSGLQQNLMAGDDLAKAHQDASAQGLIEIGTEYVSIDKLLSDVGNPIKYFLQNALVEGSEEGASTILNTVYDNLVNGGESEINQRINELMTQGYTRNDAKWAAWVEWGKGLFGDVFTGVLSGGMSSGPRAAAIYASDASQGRTIQQFDTAQPILDLAATLDLEPSVLQLVQEQQAALDAMKASQQESEAQSEEDQDNLDDEAAIESEEEDQEAEVLPERGEYEFDGNESTLTPVANEQEAEKLPNREEAMPDGRESTLTPAEEQQQEAEKLPNREESQPDGRESTLTPANEQQEAEKLSERETTMPDGESTLTPASEENAPAAEEAGDVSEAAEDMAEAAEDAAENPAPKKGKKVKVPKVSNAKLGRIYREALAKLDERAQDVLRKSFETEISQQLQERGFKGDPKATAEAISKMVSGDASMITPEVVMAVSSDRMVLEIVNDFTAPIRDFQRMAALGAGGIPAIAAKNVKGKYSTANGQRFVPERIVSISDDGKVRVTGKTVHGEVMTVDADSIDFGINDGGIEIVADVAGILGRNADALLNNMQGSQDPVKYALAFKAAMEYGQNGRSLSSAKSDTSLSTLTESQIEIAHSLGKDILEKGGRKPKKNISGISVGNVDTSAISGVKLSKQQKASINAMTRLAKVVGFNVKFVKSKADADGKYKTENGSWESSTMTLTLDIHAGSNETTDLNYAMMHTAGHELTHFIKDFADAGLWNDYQEFVMDHLYEKMSDAEIEERIKNHIKRAEKRGETMTRDGALEEVIADASGEALMNITEADLRQIAQSNPTLFGRIKQFFKKWLSDLKTNIDIAYSGNQNKTAETKAMHDVVDQLSEKWNKLFVNAVQNKAVASEATNAAAQGTRANAIAFEDYAFADAGFYDDGKRYSERVTDEETLDFLNNQETVTTYKTMQIVDGKLYPPMAAVVAGNYEDASELGMWEATVEHPELIKWGDDGKAYFKLDKGQKRGSLDARYNPYMHSSNLVLNDQFTGAYTRDNLVTVECEVPVSELTSGYHAQHAKDPVGWHAWHAGPVAGTLRNVTGTERQVLLSRWIKPVRIVPDSEVAAMYKELLDGTGITVPENVVPPSLKVELEKAGVPIASKEEAKSANAALKKAKPKKKAGTDGKRYDMGGRDVDDYLEDDYNTPEMRWAYYGIFNIQQKAQFNKKLSEIHNLKYKSFTRTSEGEYIVPIDGAIVFTNGNKDKPSISAVVEIHVYDSAETIKKLEERLNNGERHGNFDKYDAWEGLSYLFGEGTAEILLSPSERNRFLVGGRQGKVGGTNTSGSRAWRSQEPVDSEGRYLSVTQEKYFKNSKARDENGNLLVLYHGSTVGRIEVFKTVEGRRKGLYLTTSKNVAEQFAVAKGGTSPMESSKADHDIVYENAIYKLYANVVNPLRVDGQGNFYHALPTPAEMIKAGSYGRSVDIQEIGAWAIKNGYDGVIVNNVKEKPGILTTDVIVFNPDQVKYTDNDTPDYTDSTRNQERNLSELSDRELLANAVESVAQNDTERDYIKRYKKHIAELNEKQLAMQEAEEQIRELKAEDAKGNRDEIIKLQNKVDIYAKQISRADAKLLDYEATKPIKDMLTREKAEYKRKRDAKAKEQMARYRENQHQRTLDRIREVREAEANKRKAMRERADERQRKAVEHAREVGQRKVDRMKESQGKEKYRAQILQDAKKLYGWVVSPTNKGHVPEMLKRPLGEFLESIDFSSARSLKGGEATRNDRRMIKALDDLRRALSNVHDQESLDKGAVHVAGYVDLPSDYLRELDALVGKIEATLDMADKVTDTPFMLMTSEQLHEMSKMFRILNTSISKMNTVHENAMYESNRTMSGHTIDDMTSMTAKLKTNKHLAKLNSLFNWKNATPYYAFQRLGRGGKAIFDGFQNGWDKMAQNSKKLIEYAEDAFTSQQAKAWSKDIKTIELDSGEKFQMTASQAMSLYCLSKRDQAIGHLMGGGIRISDIDMGKGNTLSQVNNYILSEKDISRIIGTLTAEQKAVADKLQKFLNTVCSDWGNEISMKRFGYKMFTEEFYFPIETDANNRSRIDDKQEGKTSMFRLLNMSAMKQLTPNANNAIIIRDIFDVFSNHATDIAKYNAMALPILDFIKWYNYVEKSAVLDANGKPTGQITTRSVQKALEHAYGQDAKQYMLQFIRDINGEHDGGRNDDVINKLTNRAKTAAVGANLRVYLLQLTSMPRAAYAINPVYLARSAAKIKNYAPGKLIKGGDAQNDIGILKWKNLGFYSTDINNSVRDMVRRDQNVLDKVREWQMAPAGWMDNITGNIIYEAVKLEMADKHPNLKPGTEAYKGMLNKRVREIVYKTQVVDSTMTRSELMRSKGIISAATAFMSEPTLTVNMLNESLQEAIMKKRGAKLDPSDLSPGKKAGRAVAVFLVSATVTSIVGALADAFRDDDDYEEFEKKYLDALKKNAIDNVNIFGMIPIIKEVSDVAGKIIKGQDYKPNTLAVQVLTSASSTASAIKDWNEGKGTLANAIFNALKTASYSSGIGIYNAVRDLAAIYNTVFADRLDMAKVQTYSDSKTTAANALYEALQAGDEEKAEWILHRAEVNGVDSSKFDNSIAAIIKESYEAGKIDAETAEKHLVEYAGKDENEAYWKIQEWGYSGEGNFSKYTGLKDALKSGDRAAANAARDELVEHGASEQAISGQLSEIYNNGEATSILNLQMRSDSLYTSSLKLKADGEAHPDDFDAFITAIVNGGNISGEIDALMDKGYTVKQCMSAINGAFGKSKDTYRIMETNNSSDAGILLDRILDAYEYLGLDRAEEIAWIDANWIM